ncbi:MAG: YHS domain-containing protein [Chloroflexi bacterium]|nr:YHS domain-containing protein [Chloroflexota bacterium]MDA8236895.1 YHS domain-containing protein [Chloroflexota bacterium]
MTETIPAITDPVCGMAVDPFDAAKVEVDGRIYFFCDPSCADIFRDEPARWTEDGSGAFVHEH